MDEKAGTVKAWKVSASQIKTFRDCPRKWGFQKLDGLQDPPGKAAQFGSEVHAVLEHLLQPGAGEVPEKFSTRAIRLASKGLHLYPDKVDKVEEKFTLEVDGVVLTGFIDAQWFEEGTPVICDHKTSSDPAKWGLNPKTLGHDVQALIYASKALDAGVYPQVHLRWVYYPTRGKGAPFPVDVVLPRAEVEKRIQPVLETAREITEIRGSFERAEIEGAKDLQADPSSCGKFGGCPFADVCPRTRDDLLTSAFGQNQNQNRKEKEEEKMGLKDLLARNGKKAPPRTTDTGFPQVNPPEQPASPEVAREVSRAVGQTSGNMKSKKDKATEIAAAAMGQTTPEGAKQAAQGRLGDLERVEKKEPKPSGPKFSEGQAVVVDGIVAGLRDFSGTNARTLNALKKAGWLNWREQDGKRIAMPTDKLREQFPEIRKWEATQRGIQNLKETPLPVETQVREAAEAGKEAALDIAAQKPLEVNHAATGPATGPIPTPEPTHTLSPGAQAFLQLLAVTQDPEKANQLMDAFEARMAR